MAGVEAPGSCRLGMGGSCWAPLQLAWRCRASWVDSADAAWHAAGQARLRPQGAAWARLLLGRSTAVAGGRAANTKGQQS